MITIATWGCGAIKYTVKFLWHPNPLKSANFGIMLMVLEPAYNNMQIVSESECPYYLQLRPWK